MANADGETPLHRACGDRHASVEVFRRLLEENQEALTKKDRSGETPLHLALRYHRDSPMILRLLLDRFPSRFLGITNSGGFTPLHSACLWGVSVEIIRQMVGMFPKALRMLIDYGWAPLHLACYADLPSLEVIRYLVNLCPALCLIRNVHNESLFEFAATRRRTIPPESRSFLTEAMKEAAIAFLVCSSQGMITLSSDATAHIQRVLLPDFATQGFSMSYMSSNEHIRLLLEDPETIGGLVRNTDIQSLLKNEDNQDLICIIIPLVKAGSRINIDDLPETKHHVCILESVSNNPDCLFLHLRNNASLCCRAT
jgi:hypothetical protein